ncbi:MAG: hypothetical protein WC662_03435 [Candidatus Paceibacterota bacterium]|jgi:hypothetical protein
MEEKVKPIYEKRFALPINESAKNRLNDFRVAVKEYQKEHPEILGATIYGSMIKGNQAKETSDIDSFLYIDADNIPKENKDPNEKLQNPYSPAFKYRSELLNSLNISQKDEENFYEDLKPIILNSEIIDKNINNCIKFEIENNNYKKMLNEKYNNEMSEEEKYKLLSQEPVMDKMDFSPEIAGMFHVQIGKGVDKYRHLFLEKLNALPDKKIAESIWEEVHFTLNTFEKRKDTEKKIKIPSTFDEALKIYHPDLYKNINKKKEAEKINKLKIQITNSY